MSSQFQVPENLPAEKYLLAEFLQVVCWSWWRRQKIVAFTRDGNPSAKDAAWPFYWLSYYDSKIAKRVLIFHKLLIYY